MKVAQRFGQPPHEVAKWPEDWLGVCMTSMAAENGAEREIRAREERRARMRQKMSGGRR